MNPLISDVALATLEAFLIDPDTEPLFKAYAKTVPFIIWVLDKNGSCTYVNEVWSTFTGLHYKESLGTGWLQAICPEDRVTNKLAYQSAGQKSETYPIALRVRQSDGEYCQMMSTYYPRFDIQGNLLGYVGICQDIVEYRRQVDAQQVEATLKSQLALTNTILNNATVAIFLVDCNGICTYLNPAAEAMLGYRLEELKNKSMHTLTHHTRPDGTPYPIEECPIYRAMIDRRDLKAVEEVLIRRDGSFFPILFNARSIFQDDIPVGAVVEVLDMTETKRAKEELKYSQEELKKYTERLQRSNRDLEHFATVASHDLQEPLRKVLIFTDHLQKTEEQFLSEEGVDDLDRIQCATIRMQRLIDDLLDLSKISRRGKPFQQLELTTMLREVMTELSYSYKDVHSRVDIEGSMTIQADPHQLHQMMLQLLDNSLKFHRPEYPSLVKVSIEQAPHEQCEIAISDNGIGIKQEYLDKIFDTFTRLHGTEYAGTGIGLALVKKIVERHKGQIDVQSTPDKGTRFTITLPISTKDLSQ